MKTFSQYSAKEVSHMTLEQLIKVPVDLPTMRCEQDGCSRITDVIRFVAKIVKMKDGKKDVVLTGMCPSCSEKEKWFEAEKKASQEAIVKAFGDYKTAQKATVKIGTFTVKGQYRGGNFYPYYHLVKKHKLKCSYAANAVELVEKY